MGSLKRTLKRHQQTERARAIKAARVAKERHRQQRQWALTNYLVSSLIVVALFTLFVLGLLK